MAKNVNKGTSIGADFYSDLIKDTDFKIANTGSLMHSRTKVRTPIVVLNCLYGGGLPLGVLSEVSGVPGSGKSTFLYQCMANYQEDYPNGVSVVLDIESSMDNDRLEALGVDTERVLRLPSVSMETAFGNLFSLLTKLGQRVEDIPDLSAFIIYDSIDATSTASEQKAASEGKSTLGAGTMREDTRTLKHDLKSIFPFMEKFPFFIGMINQVMVKPNPYGGPAKVESGGGYGLKHMSHSHIVFSAPKDTYDGAFLVGTESSMELHKSKLSPKFINIPCYIDVTRGGRIDEVDSFVKYLADKNVNFIPTGSWYQFGDYLKKIMFEKFEVLKDKEELKVMLDKNYRKADMYALIGENKDLFNFLQIALIEFLDDKYPAQREINTDYQKTLIENCSYFK